MQYRINADELMHYGVLGMKWGVRNAETRAKYAGMKGRRQAKKELKADRRKATEAYLKRDSARANPYMRFGDDQLRKDVAKAEQAYTAKTGRLSKFQKKEVEKFESSYSKNWTKSYNKASDYFNANIDRINKKYESYDFSDKGLTDPKNKKAYPNYIKDAGKLWTDAYSKALIDDFGPSPIDGGKDWVKNAHFFNQYDLFYEDFIKN